MTMLIINNSNQQLKMTLCNKQETVIDNNYLILINKIMLLINLICRQEALIYFNHSVNQIILRRIHLYLFKIVSKIKIFCQFQKVKDIQLDKLIVLFFLYKIGLFIFRIIKHNFTIIP